MEGDNFVLPGAKMVPSNFAAGCMFFLAVAGKPLIELIESGLIWLALHLSPSLETDLLDMGLISALMTALYYLCFILLPFCFYAREHAGIGIYTRLTTPDGATVLIALAVGFCGFYLSVYANYFWCMFIEALGGTIPDSGTPNMDSLGDILSLMITTVILPAMCEELLFRGTVLSVCEEKGTRHAVFTTAILFMLVHSRVSGMPAEFISGILLGFIVILSGSLFAGVLYHTVHNSMALIFERLAQESGQIAAESYFEAAGGLSGIIVLLIRTMLFVCALYLLIRLLKKRHGRKALERPAIQGEKKGICEWAVWLCGLIVAVTMYVPDILRVIGVLS